jgi:hypothetical protein
VEHPCKSLANKLSKVYFMIKSLNEIMSPFMKCNIYFLKFQLFLRFGILFWGRGEEDNKKKYSLELNSNIRKYNT